MSEVFINLALGEWTKNVHPISPNVSFAVPAYKEQDSLFSIGPYRMVIRQNNYSSSTARLIRIWFFYLVIKFQSSPNHRWTFHFYRIARRVKLNLGLTLSSPRHTVNHRRQLHTNLFLYMIEIFRLFFRNYWIKRT